MRAILKTIIGPITAVTLQQFRSQCERPQDTQRDVLNQIISHNSESAFGRDYGFGAINTVHDFQNKVPVSTYDTLLPYIDKALQGEPQQLTMEQPVLFATTSGTTGVPKYIPVTPESKKSKSKLMRIWMASVLADYPTIFDGKVLTIVSPEVESYSPGGIPCGAESGHGYRAMGAAVRSNYSAPYEVYEIKDYDAKYYVLLRIACGQSISVIYTPNPSTVVLLAERLGDYTEHLIGDIRDGTLSSEFAIEPEYRALFETNLRPDPQRAAEIEKRASKNGGRLLPRHVWPDLACICCWKGGSVGMYLDRFDHYFTPGIPVRDIGYYASEVRGSIVLSNESSAGVLSITENFFEFSPVDDDLADQGKNLLLAHELKQGDHYYIYVTTKAGLYRYEMNDIVEVTGFHGKTPIIRFVQKGKGVVSYTGEKLYESQVISAVESVLADRRGSYEFIAAVGMVVDGMPQYVFLIEFAEPPDEIEAKRIIEELDKELGLQNSEYLTKRNSGRIRPPVLRVIKHGEFNNYRKREVDKGKNDGQFKILRLTADASFAEEFSVERQIEATPTTYEETSDVADLKSMLQQNRLFSSMDDETLEDFINSAEEREFQAGELVYGEMGKSGEMFFVLEGKLSHDFSLANAGDEFEPIVVGEGEVSNAVAVVGDGPSYLSCTALSHTRLLVWRAAEVSQICQQKPEVGYPFVAEVARMLLARLQEVNQRLLDRLEWGMP